jgi:hypothetical protein
MAKRAGMTISESLAVSRKLNPEEIGLQRNVIADTTSPTLSELD